MVSWNLVGGQQRFPLQPGNAAHPCGTAATRSFDFLVAMPTPRISSLITCFKDDTKLNAKDFIRACAEAPALAMEVDVATGNTPLHFACCNGAPLPVLEALLTANPGAASVKDNDGNYPITGAVANGGSKDVVTALLKAFPDGIKHMDGGQHTLLHQAACNGQSVETIAILLARCQKPN